MSKPLSRPLELLDVAGQRPLADRLTAIFEAGVSGELATLLDECLNVVRRGDELSPDQEQLIDSAFKAAIHASLLRQEKADHAAHNRFSSLIKDRRMRLGALVSGVLLFAAGYFSAPERCPAESDGPLCPDAKSKIDDDKAKALKLIRLYEQQGTYADSLRGDFDKRLKKRQAHQLALDTAKRLHMSTACNPFVDDPIYWLEAIRFQSQMVAIFSD